MFGLGPSEKSPCWVKLVTRGRPGHGSVPHGDNALARLVRALSWVEARERRARLTAPVEAMIRTLKQRGLVPAEIDPHDQATLEAVGGSTLTSARSPTTRSASPASAPAASLAIRPRRGDARLPFCPMPTPTHSCASSPP
jgi:hypothetical protein